MMASLARPTPAAWAVLVSGLTLMSALSLGLLASSDDAPPRSASADRGRSLFLQSCAHCHGDDARGSGEDGDGPDLFRLSIGNARIASVIRSGIPKEMPSFAKKHHTADCADLTAYLRTLH